MDFFYFFWEIHFLNFLDIIKQVSTVMPFLQISFESSQYGLHSLDIHLAFHLSPKICSNSSINCALNDAVGAGIAKIFFIIRMRRCRTCQDGDANETYISRSLDVKICFEVFEHKAGWSCIEHALSVKLCYFKL